MRKLNVVVRYILYLLPFVYIVYACVVYKTTGSNEALSLYNNTMTSITNSISTNPYFSSFYTWFTNNISHGLGYVNNAFAYCCYMLLIEFVLLFKNVLMYLFNVANAWLEKGVELGK